MKKRKSKVLLFTTSLLLGLMSASSATLALAQSTPQLPTAHQEPERHYGRFRIKPEPGLKISLGNRTIGRITVNGWDRDVIEAHAVSERGDEVVIVSRHDSGTRTLLLKADYADLDQPAAPTSSVYTPPVSDGKVVKVHLEVNLPRNAEIDLIQVWRSPVQVSGMETPISVSGGQSSVILKRVGAVAVRTRSGNVEVEDATGTVVIGTTSGAVRVHNVKGPVRVVSISGPIEIKCSRGRTQVANTEAPIELINVDGEVDAVATNSSVRFTGTLREDGRYDLKSMSGRVEMILPVNTHGFDATLTSYRGVIESDFNMNVNSPASDGPQQRRLIRHPGNGRARIALDSFDGFVRLTRVVPDSIPGCK
jgi:Putative adhesin